MNSVALAQKIPAAKASPRQAPSNWRHFLDAPGVSFLRNQEELAMIALPWIGGVLALMMWILGHAGFDVEIDAKTELLLAIVGFDALHIVFTFVLAFASPELRAWAKSPRTKAKSGWMKGLGPMGRTVLVGAALGIIYMLCKGYVPTASLRGMITLYLFFELMGPAQHTLAQMRGISLCYNSGLRKKFRFTESEMKTALLSEKLERWLFHSLLLGEFLYWVPEILQDDKFTFAALDQIQPAGAVLVIGSAVGLVINALFYPRAGESRKFAYVARVFLFPLKMINIFGSVSVRAAHGTEYLVVYRKMLRTSNITRRQRHTAYAVTFGICALLIVPFTMTWPEPFHEVTGWDLDDGLLTAAFVLTFIVRFSHYYLDSVMFRMSDPATRDAVAPLLTSPV